MARKFLFLFLFLLFSPALSKAQVVINEIAWMGTSVEGVEEKQWWRYEWIELYNLGDQEVRLDGWTMELSRNKLDFQFPLKGTIFPKGYFLITSSDKIPHHDLNYSNLSGNFVNSGQKIVLKDGSGVMVEEIDGKYGWFGGDNFFKNTMERRYPEKEGNDFQNWGTSKNPGGTPKSQNSIFGQESRFSFGANTQVQKEKDLAKSFPHRNEFFFLNPMFLKALVLALGSAAAILFLKRRLPSQV